MTARRRFQLEIAFCASDKNFLTAASLTGAAVAPVADDGGKAAWAEYVPIAAAIANTAAVARTLHLAITPSMASAGFFT